MSSTKNIEAGSRDQDIMIIKFPIMLCSYSCSYYLIILVHLTIHCKILMVILTKHLVTRVATNIDNGYYCDVIDSWC